MKNTESYALVTGASSGIGRAIAFELGSRSKNVLLLSLPGENLAKTAEEIKEQFQVKTDYIEIDLSLPESPAQTASWIAENQYSINLLVNNAGLGGVANFKSINQQYIDDRILLNIRALTLLCNFLIPELKKYKESHILNVSSIAAFYGMPFKSVYSASKAYVLNFSKAIRTELKETGISVSVLCPNGVYTSKDVDTRIAKYGNIGRLCSYYPEEIAKIALDKTFGGQFLIIPGRANQFLCFLRKILPPSIEQKLLYNTVHKELVDV